MNQKSIYDLSRIERYMMQMRPVLSKKALFSDGTKDYRSPAEPRETTWIWSGSVPVRKSTG